MRKDTFSANTRGKIRVGRHHPDGRVAQIVITHRDGGRFAVSNEQISYIFDEAGRGVSSQFTVDDLNVEISGEARLFATDSSEVAKLDLHIQS